MELKLMEYFKNFQLLDLLGFARLLKVEEQENFENYICEIVAAFSNEKNSRKKKLLGLAKDIAENNTEYDRLKEAIKNGD